MYAPNAIPSVSYANNMVDAVLKWNYSSYGKISIIVNLCVIYDMHKRCTATGSTYQRWYDTGRMVAVINLN